MFLFGVLKFIDPFKSWYLTQVTASELPFSSLSYWAGQLGEIIAGILFILLVSNAGKISDKTYRMGFWFANLMVIAMMVMAIYVHMHPNVPGEVLPMKIKPPVIPGFFLVLASINLILGRRI